MAKKPRQTPAPREGRGVWIAELLTKRIREVVGTAVLAGLAAAFWFGWNVAEARIKKYIIDVIAAELSERGNHNLSAPLKANLKAWRESEVGAMNLGSFTLTPSNRAYTLFVYLPDGHAGKIYYKITGDIVPKRRFVVLVMPNGKVRRIENLEESLDLSKFLSSASRIEESDDFVERPAYAKGMKAITFQLEGPDTDSGAEAPIEVRYMAFVTPAISLGQVK